MIRKLGRWLKRFLTTLSHREQIWEPRFVPTDLNEVDESQRFSEVAIQYGKSNLPSATSTEPDAGHKEIFAYFGNLVLALHANASRRLQQYSVLKPQDSPESFLHRARDASQEFSRKISLTLTQSRNVSADIQRNLKAAQDELLAFRERNTLLRDPEPRPHRVAFLAVPAVLLILEVLFNSIVFSTASEGLRGGIKMAFILAFVNIIISAMLGNAFRHVNCRELHFKVLGWFCALVLVMYIPLNLLVAHIRDAAFALQDVDAMTLEEALTHQHNLLADAQARFLSNPFGLSSIESWGLFVIGITFAIVAACDGYYFSDRLPYFAKRFQRVEGLRNELDTLQSDVEIHLEQERSQTERMLDGLQEDLNSAVKAVESYCASCDITQNIYGRQTDDYQNKYDALIQRYRDTNRMARPDPTVYPKYFEEPPKPLVAPELTVDQAAYRRILKAYAEVARQLPDEIAASKANVHAIWKDSVDSISPLSQHAKELG